MRLASLNPGDIVVYGARDELASGRLGVKVIVLAVGRYRVDQIGPCGQSTAVPDQRQSSGVVIAVPADKFMSRWDGTKIHEDFRGERAREIEWTIKHVSGQKIEFFDVWQNRRDLAIETQEAQVRYLKEGIALRSAVYAAMLDDVAGGLAKASKAKIAAVLEGAREAHHQEYPQRDLNFTRLPVKRLTEARPHVPQFFTLKDGLGFSWSKATLKAMADYEKFCSKPAPAEC